MKLMLKPIYLSIVALIICICGASAQQDVPPPLTVQPEQLGLPETEGVGAELLPDGTAVSISAEGLEAASTLDLGWIPIEPNCAYRVRYQVRPVGLQEPANIYLMLREHEAEGARPVQPYAKESVTIREIKPDPDSAWIERELSFVTRQETTFLSGSIVLVALNGELQFGALELTALGTPEPPMTPAEAWADHEKLMAELHAQAESREPLTPRPVVFSRSQMKYGLQRNYYHQWNDRPLLANRDYRMETDYPTPPPSYQRTLQQVVKYGIDGLAFFPETKGRLAMMDLHEEFDVPGVGLLPEFLTAYTPEHLAQKTEILQRALQTDFAPRIDGKLLITSYGAQSFTPAQWKEVLDELRARVGDTFVFLPSLTNVVGLRGPLMAGEPLSRAAVEKEKAYLREYLDVCDGIYFNYPPALRKKDHTFDAEFYREVFIPVFKSVLAEPEYRNKYLGLSAYRSHMSPDRGNNLFEDYTRTLRSSFEAAMDARPDVIILPEWDEQNENTSFRPTVYGANTTGRILRYYMSQIKGEEPTPWPGDDTSIPNLILSTRKILTLGEVLIAELLNVPDGTDAGQYQVQLTLQDEAGRVVREFETVTFDSTKLQEERLTIPSETLADARALVPVLTVTGYQGRDITFDGGFHHINLRATWNWDYLTVRQPLRDLLPAAQAELAWQPGVAGDGSLTLTGTVSAPEALGLVELLGDDDEAYAVDANEEFLRDDPSYERFLIEYRSLKTIPMQGTITLANAASPMWLSSGPPPVAVEADAPGAQRLELLADASEAVRWIYFAVPRDALAEAVLEWDFDTGSFSVPLSDVLEKKIVGYDFEGPLHISVQPYRRQVDMPQHLTDREVSFSVPIWPEINTEQYHLRVTTAEGRQFRSRPLLLPNVDDTNKVPLRIYSETEGRGVDVQVAASRIPVMEYEFEPERGAVLLSGDEVPFWAVLGGYTSTTTGRGSPNGLWRGGRGNYPEAATHSAPEWVEEDGRPALEFDGVGTYLELPRESLPRRGSYTLSFAVKPETAGDQFLLVGRVTKSQKGLGLQIRDGKLVANYVTNAWTSQSYESGLEVPAGAWSTITVRHDFGQMTLGVNGATESFEVTLPANNISYTIIGEGWTGNWFEGRLRDLRITHNAL
ncbi:MAG: LamG domain-containing protein [candidate division WS1 bacterium]|jgi:hypothetical protein|nr:LamG domain-containing protein [candidate division WS1 bacterium]